MSGCALGPDGKLLDTADIVFYHDADDDTPIPAPASASKGPVTATRSVLGSPICKTAGSRRPQRTLRPSTKVRDPNNAESTRSAVKCMFADQSTVQRVARKVVVSSDSDKENDRPGVTNNADDDEYPPLLEVEDSDDEYEPHHKADGDTEILDNVTNKDEDADANEGYLATKRMGDVDRQVSVTFVHSYPPGLTDTFRLVFQLRVITPQIYGLSLSVPKTTSIQTLGR
jgi:hypothetical protein